jgi:hypothetical protein
MPAGRRKDRHIPITASSPGSGGERRAVRRGPFAAGGAALAGLDRDPEGLKELAD